MSDYRIRTDDGLQFAVSRPEGFYAASVDEGELVRTDIDGLLLKVARTIGRSVADSVRESGAKRAKVEFNLELLVNGDVVVSRGGSDAHFAVTLEFE